MYIKGKIGSAEGILPNTTYNIRIKVYFASNAPTDCVGVGGQPGESVFLKVGATSYEPLGVPAGKPPFQELVMNLDKGNQSQSGVNAAVVSTIENGLYDCFNPQYRALIREQKQPITVTSNSGGEIWLLVGTDSGYEAKTELYYQSLEIFISQ